MLIKKTKPLVEKLRQFKRYSGNPAIQVACVFSLMVVHTAMIPFTLYTFIGYRRELRKSRELAEKLVDKINKELFL
jgi:hypothetical protein